MRELDIQEATTFPASPFALEAQLNDEILLGGFSPPKFTEPDFLTAYSGSCSFAFNRAYIEQIAESMSAYGIVGASLATRASVLLHGSMLEE